MIYDLGHVFKVVLVFSAKYSEYKPSWPPEPIGHNKPWKTSRVSSQLPRPPPGLTSQKQASTSLWGSGAPRLTRGWGEGGGSQDSRFGTGNIIYLDQPCSD